MPPATTLQDPNILLDLASNFDGRHVPLSAIVASGVSEQSLQDRNTYLQTRIREIASNQVKPEFVHGGLKDVFGETSELLAVLQKACDKSASLRPRARHAVQALQTVVSVKAYLNSVITIRDAVKLFDESLKQINAETSSPSVTDDYVSAISKQVDLLCSIWLVHRARLDPETTAYRWATDSIQSFVQQYRTILEKASSNALSDISWPCSQAGSTLRLTDANIRNRTTSLLQALLKLQQSFEPDATAVQYWVVSLLTEPIITRFMFHFERDCSTNRDDKPEWFLGYISRCLSQHVPVLDILLPGVSGLADAFTEKLLVPVKTKASNLLHRLANADDMSLFRHCVKHVLSFSPSISEILSESPMQAVFLAIEKDAANAQLDFIFDGLSSPWEPLDSSRQSIITTNSADVLLSMLFQITEKIIKKVPVLADRLNFAQLQQSLVSSYIGRCESLLSLRLADINHGGIRTSMVASSNWSAFIGIINSLDSVRSVLEEWNDDMVYVELQYFRDHLDVAKLEILTSADLLNNPDFEDSVNASFFAEECKRCSALVVEFIDLLVQVVLKAFRLAASFYLNRNNLTQPITEKSDAEMSLSATLCDGLSVLSSSINLAASQFGDRSFQNFWVAVAKGLDGILYDGLIRDKYHTAVAVRQLSFDLNAIFTLFRTYTSRPGAAMPMMSTALELLQSPIELIQQLVDTESGLPTGLPAAKVLNLCQRILTVASVDHTD